KRSRIKLVPLGARLDAGEGGDHPSRANSARRGRLLVRHALSRRDFLHATQVGALSIGLAELGWPAPALAEDNFTISIVGGTWGQGQIKTYITGTDFEK